MIARIRALAFCLFVAAAPAAAQSPELVEKSQAAARAMRAKEFERAVALYRELNLALPDNPGLAMNLGLALHSLGRYESAVGEFQKVVERSPSAAPAWLLLGLGHLKLGRPELAAPALDQAVKLQPANKIALLELGDALLQLQDFSRAGRVFKQLTALDPENPKAWLGLGSSYSSLSSESAERLQLVAPESGYRDLLVAESRLDLAQYRSAFVYYRRASEKLPGLPGVHSALADVYRQTGHADWAEVEQERERRVPPPDCGKETPLCSYQNQDYERVVEVSQSPDDLPYLYWRTKAYSRLAEIAHARVMGLRPSAQMHQLNATQLHIRGQYSEAVVHWRKAIAFEPSNPFLEEKLAGSLWSGGDYAAAHPLLDSLVKRKPRSARLHFLLGHGLLSRQLNEEAIAPLSKAVELDPQLLEAQASLARAYARIGKSAAAIPHLVAALSTDKDGSLHYQLARAYQTAGRAADAKRAMAEYGRVVKSIQEQAQAAAGAQGIIAP